MGDNNLHAFYSPSGASRWLTCTQSLVLQKDDPKQSKSSIYAQKGTALHACADDILQTHNHKMFYDDYVVTEKDLEEIVMPYVQYIDSIQGDVRLYEQKVKVNEDCYGTADAIIYNSDTQTLNVIDLKCGAGIYVYIRNNVQLMIYAIGAVKQLLAQKKIIKHVYIHVAQPLKDNFSTQKVEMKNLVLLEKQIEKTIEETKNGIGKYKFSEDNCRWCTHKASCPELSRIAQRTAKDEFEGSILSDKLDILPALKIFIKATEEKATELLLEGEIVDNYILKPGRATRKWTDPLLVEATLLQHFDKKDIKNTAELLSVAKIATMMKKKKIEIDLDMFIESIATTTKIAKINNK